MKEWTREELEEQIIGKMTAHTIPVGVMIEGTHRILDLSEMETILRQARVISQQQCGCRTMMKNCGEPLDGCLGIDEGAESAIRSGESRQVTVDEALAALRRTYEKGMVHIAYICTGQDRPFMICSCCSCCCHTLGAALRYGYPDHIFASRLIARQDERACIHCGACVGRCHFKAREMREGRVYYDPHKCFGCGLCINSCPPGALTMAQREAGSAAI